jgi:hypothetical protein
MLSLIEGGRDGAVAHEGTAQPIHGLEVGAAVRRERQRSAGQVDDRHAQHPGEFNDRGQAVHGADAALDLGQPALGAPDELRELRLGQPTAAPVELDPLTDGYVLHPVHVLPSAMADVRPGGLHPG